MKHEQSTMAPALEEIADGIIKLSKISEDIKKSRLTEKAILVLLNHVTGLPQKEIKLVFDSLPELERIYLKKKVAT